MQRPEVQAPPVSACCSGVVVCGGGGPSGNQCGASLSTADNQCTGAGLQKDGTRVAPAEYSETDIQEQDCPWKSCW